jgi:dihydrofolate reductase
MSLDGYVVRPSGALAWFFADQDCGYDAFYGSCDRLILGRNTYEQIQASTHISSRHR